MNLYEGMVVFPESMKEEALEESIANVKAEIEKLEGAVESTTRLGKRSFAHPMQKQRAGHYAVIGFRAPGAAIQPLRKRLKLMPEVFRAQIVRAPEPQPVEEEAPSKEERGHDVG